MFRLIRFIFWLAAVAAIWWFSVTVPLGRFTLWEHIKRIWHSQETQDLVNGTKDAAKTAVDKEKPVSRPTLDAPRRNR